MRVGGMTIKAMRGILCLSIFVSLLSVAPSGNAAVTTASARQQVAQAKLELQKGNIDNAIKLLTQAKQVLGNAPGSCECHYNLGKALCSKAKNEKKTDGTKASGDFLNAKHELRTAIRVGAGNVISKQANEYLMTNLPAEFLTPKTGEGTEMIIARLGLRGSDRGAESAAPRAKVFEFYADWCEPCKLMKPVIQKIKEQYGDRVDVTAINVDDKNNAEIIDQYDVSPIPTVIYINPDGQVVGYSIGFAGEKNIQREVQKIVASGDTNPG